MDRLACSLAVLLALVAAPRPGLAQSIRGVVVDQTGLPLPGATVQVIDGLATVETLVTEADGTFVLDALLPGDAVLVTLMCRLVTLWLGVCVGWLAVLFLRQRASSRALPWQ